MNDEGDYGLPGPVAFVRVERQEGEPVAVFATDDGGSFCLDEKAVRGRITFLESAEEDPSEERKALAALHEAS